MNTVKKSIKNMAMCCKIVKASSLFEWKHLFDAFDDQVTYYVPAGKWTNFFFGEIVEGPGWRRERHDFLSLPLLVRPGSVIPVGDRNDHPDYDYAENVTLQVYEFADGNRRSVVIPDPSGKAAAVFEIKHQDRQFSIETADSQKFWQVELIGIHAVRSVEGGRYEKTRQGILIVPVPGRTNLSITL